MSVNFYDDMDEMRSLKPNTSSWSTSLVSKATYQLVAVGAQTKGTRVTCRITKDGRVASEQRAVGRYTLATCSG